MKPRLLGDTPRDFSANGIALINTVSAFVTEQLNGEYSLTMEIAAGDPHFTDIHVGTVIAALPNKTDPRQGFVVEHIGKPIDGICEIYATHIAQFRAKLIPVRPFTANSLSSAIANMTDFAMEDNPFTLSTDKTSTTWMTVAVPRTYRELLGGVRGSLLDTYGGEYKFNNYSIELLARRGRPDTQIRVLYGKTMTDFNLQEDFSWTDSLTGVIPFWSMEGGATVYGSIQYSPYAENYPYARTGTLDCTPFFAEQPTADQLNTYAATWISTKGILSTNLEVAFDSLQFSADKEMQIGDTVTVINSLYGVNLKRRIVGTVFNVLTEEYDTVTIGDLKASINDAIGEAIDSSVSNMKLLAENVMYSSAASGLSASNVQAALDAVTNASDFVMENVSVPYTLQPINGYNGSVSIAKSGYIPIAIAGWNTGSNLVFASRCDIWQSDNTAHYDITNFSSSNTVTSTMTIKVLYVKNR